MDNKYKHIESNIDHNDDFFSPSDGVWDQVEQELFPAKKSKNPIFLWLILGLVLILITSTIILKNNSNRSDRPVINHSLQNTSSLVTNSTKTTVDRDEKVQKDKADQMNTESLSQNALNEDVVNEENRYATSSNVISEDKINSRKSLLNTAFSKQKVVHQSIFNKGLVEEKNEAEEENLTSVETNEMLRQTIAVKYLPHLPLEGLDINNSFDFRLKYIDLPKNNSSIKWFAGIAIESDINIHNNTLEKSISLSETVKRSEYDDYFSAGMRLGVAAGKRWMILSGLQYYQSTISTTYDLSIPYDLNTEYHDPTTSEYLNTFDHTLPTIGGAIETSLTLRRADNSQVDHNEGIGLDLTTSIKDHVISIPIGIRRYFNDRFSGFYLKTEVQGGFVIHRAIQNKSTNSHHSIVKVKNGKLGLSQSFGDKVSLNSNIGIGYSLPIPRISPTTQVDLSIGVTQRLAGTISNHYFQSEVMFRYGFGQS